MYTRKQCSDGNHKNKKINTIEPTGLILQTVQSTVVFLKLFFTSFYHFYIHARIFGPARTIPRGTQRGKSYPACQCIMLQ